MYVPVCARGGHYVTKLHQTSEFKLNHKKKFSTLLTFFATSPTQSRWMITSNTSFFWTAPITRKAPIVAADASFGGTKGIKSQSKEEDEDDFGHLLQFLKSLSNPNQHVPEKYFFPGQHIHNHTKNYQKPCSCGLDWLNLRKSAQITPNSSQDSEIMQTCRKFGAPP